MQKDKPAPNLKLARQVIPKADSKPQEDVNSKIFHRLKYVALDHARNMKPY